jgi:cerevisin
MRSVLFGLVLLSVWPSLSAKQYVVSFHTARDSFKKEDLIQVDDLYRIGNWTSVLVSATEAEAEAVKSDPHVSGIFENIKCVRVCCNTEATGDTIWGLSRISSRDKPLYSNATYTYSDEDDGSGVDVYIVDTGINVEHVDFGGRATRGFTAPHLSLEEGDDDLNGHGTHCAGIAASKTYGVAKKANLIAVKVLDADGSGYLSDAIAGIEFVYESHLQSGRPSVMNLSFGLIGSYSAFTAAVSAAVMSGVNSAAAAGNEHSNACANTPANIETVITVAATDQDDCLASYSNYGGCVDVLAPGSYILSTYIGSTTATAVLSGTSMAAPFVAGWVARYLSSFSVEFRQTPRDVKAALKALGTRGVILGLYANGTPNRLLYAACDSSSSTHGNLLTVHFLMFIYLAEGSF